MEKTVVTVEQNKRYAKISVVSKLYIELTRKSIMPIEEFDALCDMSDEEMAHVEQELTARLDILKYLMAERDRLKKLL